jgi:hypothetical protein
MVGAGKMSATAVKMSAAATEVTAAKVGMTAAMPAAVTASAMSATVPAATAASRQRRAGQCGGERGNGNCHDDPGLDPEHRHPPCRGFFRERRNADWNQKFPASAVISA